MNTNSVQNTAICVRCGGTGEGNYDYINDRFSSCSVCDGQGSVSSTMHRNMAAAEEKAANRFHKEQHARGLVHHHSDVELDALIKRMEKTTRKAREEFSSLFVKKISK